jgi:uracil-DNA glycosylase
MSNKYYAVAKGHNPGIYENWSITQENVKGFPGAIYEGFKTKEEAQQFLNEYNVKNPVTIEPVTLLDTLTNEQLSVINHLLEGKSLFLTGSGGVGKSYLLSVLYNEFPGLKKSFLAKKNPGSIAKLPRIQICALTGCAALLLGHKAKTLHSWAGVGLGKGSVSELYTKIRRNQKSMRNWLCTDLLIIDEISMMTAEFLDKLNQLAKKIRSNQRSFGGIQLLLVGDFYQLPPVNKSDEATRFAFESDAWKEIITSSIELTVIQRQKDELFQKILKEARIGALCKESCEILNERQGRNWKKNKIRPTLLFPRRAEVDMINDSNLRALTGRRYTYKARLVYDGKVPEGFTESDEGFQRVLQHFDSDASYSKELELMLSAQVMLIANTDPDAGLVNGSRGVVVGFCPSSELPIVEFMNGVKKMIGTHTWPIEDFEFVSRAQVPLRLAWAGTIHKCVSEDTLLSIPGKGLIKIKDLECKNQEKNTLYTPFNVQVSGICENKDIIEVYKGEIEDGIKFTTTFGYEITTSNRHPLLVFNNDTFTFEWKKSPDITLDDYIVLKKGANIEGNYFPLNDIEFKKPYSKIIKVPSYLNEEFGYFLGVMLGDGSINNKTYRFDLLGIDMDILDNCINILNSLFNIKVERHECNENVRKTKTDRIFFHSKQLIEVFKYIGYNFAKADKKQIPDCILSSPLSVQKAVIQGLYDTDGGVSNTVINFTTTSEIMGKQLQQMMLNMDIPVSRIMMRDNVIEKNWKRVYRLNISGKSALKFVNNIGFKCKRKLNQSQDRFYEKESLQKNNKSQSFEIPNGSKLINSLRNEMRDGQKRIKTDKITRIGHRLIASIINSSQKLRCDSLNVIINEILNISGYPTGKLLSFMYNNGIIIDTLKSIENVSNIQMYDIGVSPINTSGLLPDGHDFIGNGFINHNCQGSTLDSALVDIGSGVFEYGQAYVALSRVRSLEALYVYDFDPTAFKAHPKVKEFYGALKVKEIDNEEIKCMILAKFNFTTENLRNDDMKPIVTESSKPIQAITVLKQDVDTARNNDNDSSEIFDSKNTSSIYNNWLYDSVPSSWKDCLLSCRDKLLELSTTLNSKEFLPRREDIWRALVLTPPDAVKVVILGQDPYPTVGNAHGLAFSVLPDVRPIPASLKNIYKELVTDVGFTTPLHGNLEAWTKQGVLLLNTVLTVEEGAPQSHSKIGWEEVTDQIIRSIAATSKNVVFVLWGKSAQVKKKLLNLYLNTNGHRVFESAHPSPLSATKGFYGSRPFSTINTWLEEMGKSVIDWQN